MVRIELKIITLDIPERHHTLDLRRLHLNIHSPFCKARYMSSEHISHLVLHELDELVLDACSLCLGRNHLALRAMLTELVNRFLLHIIPCSKVSCKKAVHHHIRITPDRRCEMSIVLERKSIVSKVFRIITSLGHGSEREKLYGIVFRGILSRRKEAVEFLGDFLSARGRSHTVAEIADEVT